MEWFIKKGDAVSENESFFTNFVWTGPVSQGRIKKIKMDIYSDRTARTAPLARDDNVGLLCQVEGDVGHIPEDLLNRRKGNDGQMYYELNWKIEAECLLFLSFGRTDSVLTVHQISLPRRSTPCCTLASGTTR